MPCRLADAADGSGRGAVTLKPAELHPRAGLSLQASHPPSPCSGVQEGAGPQGALLAPALGPPEGRAGARYAFPGSYLELDVQCGRCGGTLDPVDRGTGICGACEYGLAP